MLCCNAWEVQKAYIFYSSKVLSCPLMHLSDLVLLHRFHFWHIKISSILTHEGCTLSHLGCRFCNECNGIVQNERTTVTGKVIHTVVHQKLHRQLYTTMIALLWYINASVHDFLLPSEVFADEDLTCFLSVQSFIIKPASPLSWGVDEIRIQFHMVDSITNPVHLTIQLVSYIILPWSPCILQVPPQTIWRFENTSLTHSRINPDFQ